MNATAYAFLGLTAIVAMLGGVLMFALLRFSAAARETRRLSGDGPVEAALLSTALEEAIARLKAQERATAARAAASEHLSSQIVASLTSGVIVADHQGRIQIVNPAARRILHLPADDGPDEDVLGAETPLRAVIEESLGTEHPIIRRTVTIARPEGPMRLGVTVSPLSVDGGRDGAICLFTDLTAVLLLEEQLRLKEALARLGELTAGLAHEFRNGLATIHGYSRLLDPTVLPAQQRVYLDGLRDETDALGEIVTNFLRFARPEPLTLAPVPLRALVERAAADAPRATVSIAGEFGQVDADEVLLRQALSNLFRNSVEACTAAGVAPEVLVDGRIDRADGRVLLTISDNGPGIQPESLPKLFQPFFTTRPGGTGLGLAIVQKIVVSHNGLVTAANRPEGGASFQVSLPAAGY